MLPLVFSSCRSCYRVSLESWFWGSGLIQDHPFRAEADFLLQNKAMHEDNDHSVRITKTFVEVSSRGKLGNGDIIYVKGRPNQSNDKPHEVLILAVLKYL